MPALISCIGCTEIFVIPSPIEDQSVVKAEVNNDPNGNTDGYYPDGNIMDNGRVDRDDDIVWDFYWPEVAGADGYQLYVIGKNAIYPVIDTFVSTSSYTNISEGSYIVDRHRYGWEWKVRARIGGIWGDWMPAHNFDVEPLNTDPPKGG